MTKKYLIAADADQIQHLLFRSSQLREVLGGSIMLARFCNEFGEMVSNEGGEKIISAGGNFRLAFADPDEATAFKEELAELFARETGGSITVVGPEAYIPEHFQQANEALQQQLQEAKTHRPGVQVVVHAPIIALCTSCGLEIAGRYSSPTPELEEEQQDPATYLCESCRAKAESRIEEQTTFLGKFRQAIERRYPEWYVEHRQHLKQPNKFVDVLGDLDSANYVGYILADGNGMGKRFGNCTSENELSTLSEQLEEATWASLADPLPDLLKRLGECNQRQQEEPLIVPLIVGGDDLLALAPARYAIDIARRIGETFEREMGRDAAGEQVTIGVSVIICQNHYPYKLAHRRGHVLLEEAKRLGKHFKASTLTFEVITGNELTMNKGQTGSYRSSLKPYWIGRYPESADDDGVGLLPLQRLFDERINLQSLPNRRRAQLRQLYDPRRLRDDVFDLTKWNGELAELRRRVNSPKLEQALAQLGSRESVEDDFWRIVYRPDTDDPEKEKDFKAQAMLDLLEGWDYLYQLDEPTGTYYEGRNNEYNSDI